MALIKKQEADARFNSINVIFYYQPGFPQVPFVEVKSPRELMNLLRKLAIQNSFKMDSSGQDVSNISNFTRGDQKSWRGWYFIPFFKLKKKSKH